MGSTVETSASKSDGLASDGKDTNSVSDKQEKGIATNPTSASHDVTEPEPAALNNSEDIVKTKPIEKQESDVKKAVVIEDFGEKIAGSRKDALGRLASEVSAEDYMMAKHGLERDRCTLIE